MPGDVRLIQLARILALDPATLSHDAARAAISERPADLASAILREAADNDDVTSTAAALDYLESRLAELGDLIDEQAAVAIREGFARRLRAWE